MATKKTSSGPTETLGGYNDFTLTNKFTYGYRNREDITVLPPGVMVRGSQNVLTNTFQRIGIRNGYTLDGQSNSDLAPIASSFDWQGTNGEARNMRSGFLTNAGNDGKLQYRYVDALGVITWRDLLTSLTSVDFNYSTFWVVPETLNVMYAVNNTPNLYEWSGGITTIASSSGGGGIVNDIHKTPNTLVAPVQDSGGYDYAVNDVLTLIGGGNDAQIKVLTVDIGAVKTSSLSATGANYAPGDLVTVSTPTNPGHNVCFATFVVDTVDGGGAILTYTVQKNGVGYTAGTSGIATTSSGIGTGATFHVLSVGNGVITWDFLNAGTHGTGYAPGYYFTTGGAGTNAIVDVFAVTSGTLTKNGTSTWAQENFYLNRTGQAVTVDGVSYTYIGGADSTTLFGVSPDPSGIPVNSIAHQTPIVIPNAGDPFGLPLDFNNALVATLDQHLYIGSLVDSRIWISSINLINPAGVFNPASAWRATRVAPEGSPFQIITTSPPTAFVPQEEFIYIAAGQDEWYQVNLNVDLNSADLTVNPIVRPVESVNVVRLNTTAQQAAQTQAMTSKIANSIVFLSHEPIIQTFGRVPNILAQTAPQMSDISYSIINDMNRYDFTNAAVFYFRKFVFVAVPREGLVLMYNMTDPSNPYWEAPQVLPISRFSIIGGAIYGHSSQVSETYKLFDGTNDIGFPILASATFSFNNYGQRAQTKGYNEFYVEGYISANTTLTLGIQYDIDGCATNTHFDILGSDAQIVCLSGDDASLGKVSLGKRPLGGLIVTDPNANKPKFRVIKTFPTDYFYEDQISFTSEQLNAQWEILSFGPQLLANGSLNTNITQ